MVADGRGVGDGRASDEGSAADSGDPGRRSGVDGPERMRVIERAVLVGFAGSSLIYMKGKVSVRVFSLNRSHPP